MSEKNRKAGLYLKPVRTYWQSTAEKSANIQLKTKLGYYPLSIAPRIAQGHYEQFDENGIPMLRNQNGEPVYHWTTICSFALGNWELFLDNGDLKHRDMLLKITDLLLELKHDIDGVSMFISYESGRSENDIACAMNQGEAISVLVRAYEETSDIKYLNTALSGARAFENPYGHKGVVSGIQGTHIPWFLEAGKFILNGHNYAVWGLYELNQVVKTPETQALFDRGWQSVEKALPMFDAGYWSWYWANEPRYMATIMYHNLHIIQLEHLARVSGSEIIGSYARKFERYAANPLNRLRSAASVFKSKVSR